MLFLSKWLTLVTKTFDTKIKAHKNPVLFFISDLAHSFQQ